MFHVFLVFPRAAEREQRRKRCVERVADLFDGGCGRGLGGHAVAATWSSRRGRGAQGARSWVEECKKGTEKSQEVAVHERRPPQSH